MKKPSRKPTSGDVLAADMRKELDAVVLLVTPDTECQRRARAVIENAGLAFSVANRGAKALRLFESAPAMKIIIMDERIPDVSIATLGTDIRELATEEGRAIYTILLVDEARGAEGVMAALRAGADDFLAIPYRDDTMLSRVEVGIGMVRAMESAASGMSCLDVTGHLVREHALLRDIRDLMVEVGGRLDRGIPSDVLSWAVSVVYLADYECHMAKEDAYIDAFVGNVFGEHPEWFADASTTSFESIQKQHAELDSILRSIRVELARYLRLKAILLEPVNKSIRGYDLGMDIGEWDDELEGALGNIRRTIDEYYAERESLVEPLKQALARYAAAVEPHFQLEERIFFPFSCKYINGRDAKKLMKTFERIDEKAGRARIEAEGAKVKKLLATMRAANTS